MVRAWVEATGLSNPVPLGNVARIVDGGLVKGVEGPVIRINEKMAQSTVRDPARHGERQGWVIAWERLEAV